MKQLFKAIDKIDGEESFFLRYENGEVAVMMVSNVSSVQRNAHLYLTDDAERFEDAINPVLVAEWD